MFEPIFEKLPYAEREERILNEIHASESECVPFMIACGEWDGWWGIWLTVDEMRLLVNPIDLVSSIYRGDRYYPFDTPRAEVNTVCYEGNFYVDIRLDDHVVEWQLRYEAWDRMERLYFTYGEYVSKITRAITELHGAFKAGKQIAYDPFDADLEGVEMCLKQLEIKSTFPSNYTLMTKDVCVESFCFTPVHSEWNGKHRIGIGNRTFETVLSHWDCCSERIRHQLENFVYEHEAVVRLPFDCLETVVTLRRTSVLDQVNRSENGIGYQYKEFMIVEIEPNGYVHMPILKGFCDVEATVKTFYEGLLKHTLRFGHSSLKLDEHELPRMVAYNKLKSPIIESFLRGEKLKEDEYAIRQVHVKQVITIQPEHEYFLFDADGNTLDLDDIYDQNGNPVDLIYMYYWAEDIEDVYTARRLEMPYEMDWVYFHRRGLHLAKQLREMASTDFDIWYEAPFEDNSGFIPTKTIIL